MAASRIEIFEQMLAADPGDTMVMFGLAKEQNSDRHAVVEQRAGPSSLRAIAAMTGQDFPGQAGHGARLARDVGDRPPQRQRAGTPKRSAAVPFQDTIFCSRRQNTDSPACER